MGKPPPAPAARPESAGSSWATFGLIALIGLIVGATGMYLLLRPGLPPAAPAGTPPAVTDSTSHLPEPSLTAGLPPAQADRALGNFHYDHQNWAEAIRYYESALKQGSDDADIRTDLGNAYRFAHRPDEALVQYRLAQRMNPTHEFSLFNQGALYLEDLKQPQPAIEAWTEYLRRFPQGGNAALAQQLIAQARRSPARPEPAIQTSGPSNAEVERLMRLVPPSSSPGKP